MREPVILDQLLDRALAESDYYAKRARFARENPQQSQSSAAWALPLSITAPGLRAPAKCI